MVMLIHQTENLHVALIKVIQQNVLFINMNVFLFFYHPISSSDGVLRE